MAATTTKDKEKVKEAKATKAAGKYYYAVGRRKTSTCTVRLFPNGSGNVTVNQRDLKDFVGNQHLVDTALFPLRLIGKAKNFDMTARAVGGGITGQAEAMRLAVAKALVEMDPSLRSQLKAEGLLSRDARRVQRKMFGKKKARKSPQWSKR